MITTGIQKHRGRHNVREWCSDVIVQVIAKVAHVQMVSLFLQTAQRTDCACVGKPPFKPTTGKSTVREKHKTKTTETREHEPPEMPIMRSDSSSALALPFKYTPPCHRISAKQETKNQQRQEEGSDRQTERERDRTEHRQRRPDAVR
jgi:hypothetical protein